jgi:hypothetical protein
MGRQHHPIKAGAEGNEWLEVVATNEDIVADATAAMCRTSLSRALLDRERETARQYHDEASSYGQTAL